MLFVITFNHWLRAAPLFKEKLHHRNVAEQAAEHTDLEGESPAGPSDMVQTQMN